MFDLTSKHTHNVIRGKSQRVSMLPTRSLSILVEGNSGERHGNGLQKTGTVTFHIGTDRLVTDERRPM
jgi:hypothetical protein